MATYQKYLIEKVESVIRRMRWKAFYFLKGEKSDSLEDTRFGFKSRRSPPQVEELRGFEEDLTKMVEGIRFRKVNEPFQNRLKEDIKELSARKDVIVRADKTTNMYSLTKEQYTKLLRDNTTKNYQVASENAYTNANLEAKRIARGLGLDDRVDILAKAEAFVTLKDHKDRFENDLPCRLINPAKPQIGKVSKAILDRIIQSVKEATSVNLWRKTKSVIDWFDAIDDKPNHTFVCFDVVDFYPSITEDLLKQALDFASQFTLIEEEEKEIILHSRKSLLFVNGRPWIKKTKGMFDVTMGSFDGAEVCELVGAFLLHHLSQYIERFNIGLYRDDGLAVLKNTSGQVAERARKNIIKVFKSFGLRVTIDVNIKVTNYLDVTFNLVTGKYKPYRKPGDTPVYLNAQSNHPPVILKNLPNAIGKRLTTISCDEETFNIAAPAYNNALHASGFLERVEYDRDHGTGTQRKKRRRKIIWFNPPFSKNVASDVGASFLRLVNKHFPKKSKLGKIFNRGTVKVSYSCLPNVGSIIQSSNRKKLETSGAEKPCNCRVKQECPLRGECQAECTVYEATIETETESRSYVGLSEPPFKARYANHMSSLRNERYRGSTELSKYAWELKSKNQPFTLSWRIKDRARSYNTVTKRCNLCLTEKYRIITADKASSLNKRTELVAKCRHASKYLLCNFLGEIT